MKQSLLLGTLASLLTGAIGFSARPASDPTTFYYTYNKKVPLVLVPGKAVLRYAMAPEHEHAAAAVRALAATAQVSWKDARTALVTIGGGDAGSKEQIDLKELMQAGLPQAAVITSSPLYKAPNGEELTVTNEFAAKFLPSASAQQIADLAAATGSTVKWTAAGGLILLTVPKGGDALASANRYQESGLVEFAHPNFLQPLVKTQTLPNDEYFPRQFYLHNTGQVISDNRTGTPGADIKAPEAWALSRGSSSITVAVLDDGISANHPDLPNARQVRLPNSNFADGDPNDPSPRGKDPNDPSSQVSYASHGNACAGILAATQGNGEGISGIAPNCKIMPIRIFGSNLAMIGVADVARAISFAKTNGADIISNSWALGSTDPNFAPAIVNAINDATTTGRNGKGCVVVFAAGNTATHSAGSNGQIYFPADVNIPGVLTVGASDRYDKQADYSPTSAPSSTLNQVIDVVAPSHRAYSEDVRTEAFEIWSIDAEDGTSKGSNPWPNSWDNWKHDYYIGTAPIIGEQLPSSGINYLAYTGRFGGTSAACPQVAGIAALILSVNPNLTQQQVFDNITSNADKVGGYTYTNGRSNELGYGRINAYKALNQVCTPFSFTGPSQVCASTVSFQAVSFQGSSADLKWTATPNNLFTVSSGSGITFNTAAASSSAKGIATIKATSACGMSFSMSVNVGAGEPTGTYYYNGTRTLQTVNFIPSVTRINLTLNGSNSYVFTSSSSSVPVTSFDGFTAYFDMPTSGVTINATATNSACGLAGHFAFALRSGYAYSFAPNPVSDQLTVTATDQADSTNSPASTTAPPFDANLYDSYGKKVKTQHSNHSKAIFDVRTLPEGLYNLRVGEGKDAFSERIQVKH